MPTNPRPIPSHLSSANKFKMNFLMLYNAITFYANTFTFIKCQSLQNQFSDVIQHHRVLRQYIHLYQVPISSKSIFSSYPVPSRFMPIPSCLSSANQFKINFLLLYNAIGSYVNTFTFIKCQSVQHLWTLECSQKVYLLRIFKVWLNCKEINACYFVFNII